MPEPTLSERLQKFAGRLLSAVGGEPTDADIEDLCEAARLLAPYEQPEVAELLDRVEALKHTGQLRWAADLRDHARALAELAEACEKLETLTAWLDGCVVGKPPCIIRKSENGDYEVESLPELGEMLFKIDRLRYLVGRVIHEAALAGGRT